MILAVWVGAVSVLVWFGILFHPARPWDFWPVGDDEAWPSSPQAWPSVCILVPARNEAQALPKTLPALLSQDYPGQLTVVVVDDRSEDHTAEVARQIATASEAEERLIVVAGAALPEGWVGKIWALEQGASICGLRSPGREACLPIDQLVSAPEYLLLTDADIRHAPQSVRRLVTESEEHRLMLNSRMARLRCVSKPEQLLIPAFVFFFNLLYPMRWVNSQKKRRAAAAGGCVLLASPALKQIGGFASIRDEIIDDVNLAKRVKACGLSIRLALSRTEVESLRIYDTLDTIWSMVRRTAFTELGYSVLRLIGTVLGLALLFIVPPLWCMGGLLFPGIGEGRSTTSCVYLLTLEGLLAWGVMARVYWPAVRFFGIPRIWTWALPVAGILYGAMTLDSAVRYWTGAHSGWRER